MTGPCLDFAFKEHCMSHFDHSLVTEKCERNFPTSTGWAVNIYALVLLNFVFIWTNVLFLKLKPVCEWLICIHQLVGLFFKPGKVAINQLKDVKLLKTRMHCSRMRTAHSLTVSRSICHTCPLPCTPPTMHAPHHAWPPAMRAPPAMHTPYHTCPPTTHAPLPCMSLCHACPLPVDRILDTRFWKYYLAPTSLRAVITQAVWSLGSKI